MTPVELDFNQILNDILPFLLPTFPAVAFAISMAFLFRFLKRTDDLIHPEPIKPYRIHPNLVEKFKDGLAILYYRYRSIMRNSRKGRDK